MTDPNAATYSEDAERSVLGGLMFRPGLIGKLPLEVEDFFAPKHQAIWSAMLALDESGTPVDRTTVVGELRRADRLGLFQGQEMVALAYVADLELSCPSPDNVERYVKDELHWYARKRRTCAVLAEQLHRARSASRDDGTDALTEAAAVLMRFDNRTEDPSRSLGDAMLEEVRAIQHDLDHNRGEWVGSVPTGLHKLDQNIGGIPLGVTTVILGDTGVGKTTLAMKLARAAVDIGNDRPIFISYEDSIKSYARRGLAQESGVPTMRIGARRFSDGEARRVIVDGMNNAGRRRERIIRFRGQPMSAVCQTIRRLRARGPEPGAATIGKLCILDYWQAVQPPPGRREMSPVEAFHQNALMLEDLADEQDIAMVVMSQVNDDTEKRQGVPSMRDVAGGRDLVKGAKLVIGIYRPSLYDKNADPNLGKLLILKNNGGETHAGDGSRRVVDVRLALATHQMHDTEQP